MGSQARGLPRYFSVAPVARVPVDRIKKFVAALVLGRGPVALALSVGVALFVVLRHRANIDRLLAGTENRIARK